MSICLTFWFVQLYCLILLSSKFRLTFRFISMSSYVCACVCLHVCLCMCVVYAYEMNAGNLQGIGMNALRASVHWYTTSVICAIWLLKPKRWGMRRRKRPHQIEFHAMCVNEMFNKRLLWQMTGGKEFQFRALSSWIFHLHKNLRSTFRLSHEHTDIHTYTTLSILSLLSFLASFPLSLFPHLSRSFAHRIHNFR